MDKPPWIYNVNRGRIKRICLVSNENCLQCVEPSPLPTMVTIIESLKCTGRNSIKGILCNFIFYAFFKLAVFSTVFYVIFLSAIDMSLTMSFSRIFLSLEYLFLSVFDKIASENGGPLNSPSKYTTNRDKLSMGAKL